MISLPVSEITFKAYRWRKYLDPSLNIILMYEMYNPLREGRNLEVAKPYAYRKIFNEEYNLGLKKLTNYIFWQRMKLGKRREMIGNGHNKIATM